MPSKTRRTKQLFLARSGSGGETAVGHRRLNLVWYDPEQGDLLHEAGLLDGQTVHGSLAPGSLPTPVRRRLADFAAASWPSPWREALAVALEAAPPRPAAARRADRRAGPPHGSRPAGKSPLGPPRCHDHRRHSRPDAESPASTRGRHRPAGRGKSDGRLLRMKNGDLPLSWPSYRAGSAAERTGRAEAATTPSHRHARASGRPCRRRKLAYDSWPV
jgi:hypothetical protein